MKGLPSTQNPSISVQLTIYSDAANVSLLVPESPQYQKFLAERNEALKSAVAPLTAEWILPVSYIQEEAYRGATRLTESLPEIQNNIIAAQIANQIYGQKTLKDLNLSFIAFDDKGTPAGYLIAYPAQSEYNKPGILKKGDPVIYVHDIAVREKYIGSGRFASRLLLTLMEKWALLGDIPILGDVRESTSYPMLKRAEKLGYIQLTELQKDADTTKVLIRKGSQKVNRA